MSTLLNALRRADAPAGTPHIPSMGLAARPEPTTPRWIWPLLALLALMLGAGANYGWHRLNTKPVEQKVEVTHKVIPPFVRVEPRELTTEPLPPPLPQPEPKPAAPQQSPVPTLPGFDLSGVSPELAQRFAQAVGSSQPQAPAAETSQSGAPSLSTLPYELQQQVPPIAYGSHIYSSNPAKRSVILNRRELREGSALAPGVTIQAIEQDFLLLQVGGQVASLKALQDWHP